MMTKKRWASRLALMISRLVAFNALPTYAEAINRGIEADPYHEARPAPAFLQPDVNCPVIY